MLKNTRLNQTIKRLAFNQYSCLNNNSTTTKTTYSYNSTKNNVNTFSSTTTTSLKREYCSNKSHDTSNLHFNIRQEKEYQQQHQDIGSGPLAIYDQMINDKKIRIDTHQRETVKLLQSLFDQIKALKLPTTAQQLEDHQRSPTESSTIFSKWLSSKLTTIVNVDPLHSNQQQEIKGIYLFGDVGCGKSFLMDLFYDSINIEKKKRIHFHHFMLDVHKRIHKWRMNKRIDENDPIPPLAKELVSEAWLLCFDEFQVTDVSDAMILKRLFSQMFDHGAILVTTSNRPPPDLYKNGLNRQLFLPFIDFLQQKCLVHNLSSGLDYRLSGTRTKKVFFQPSGDPTNLEEMEKLYQTLTHGEMEEQVLLAINASRNVVVPRSARGVARFTFGQLCEKALGAADYIVVAQNYHTVFIDNIPMMNESTKNQARRFITLVDVLYEHKVKLICTAAAPPNQLFMSTPDTDQQDLSYTAEIRQLTDDLKLTPEQLSRFTGEEERFMFSRAVSRLIEMQSDLYLNNQSHK
ncbi:putative ATPase [Cavenderia fasciculata]|uniref:ATPase n=1 Tax=Cavenderia fasciculata TaxID=261658 RepID=F4QDW8_CACFS|nr:putative ATPase [Cavenderia fasciculata]EGG13915.1 putative ATPase [Cavenderia fasciculata]|eukprot:XP_004350623.1 putative ATPase [Cavenderia fasciculata]